MKTRNMIVWGIMLLMATFVLAQAGTEGHKKAAAGKTNTAAAGGSAEQTLLDIENKWTEAGMKQDPAILEPYLADGFMALSADGTYTAKKEYLAGIKKAKWQTSELQNMKAHVYGNHAIVTGDWRGKGTDASGKSVDRTEHWIDSFVKSPSGKWLCTSDAGVAAK